jgi:hypothetical protein
MDLENLKEQVKRNNDISDAHFWGYYSLCGLLMRMRELFRSEHSLWPWEEIRKEEMSSWITSREALWKSLEDANSEPLEIDGQVYDPFDVDRINTALNHVGMVYGGGYGRFHKPTFFLAELVHKGELFDYQVYYAGKELCRDLSTSLAMLQGRCIFMRLDHLTMLLWDKYQELLSRRFKGLLHEAFSWYGMGGGSSAPEELYRSIETLSREIADLFVLHEVGEAFEDEHSEEWLAILSQNKERSTEFSVRGVKDLLADTSEMGPLKSIIVHEKTGLLYFHMVFLDGIRKELFPELLQSFQSFTENQDWSALEEARKAGYRRAQDLRDHVLQVWREKGETEDIGVSLKQYLSEQLSQSHR